MHIQSKKRQRGVLLTPQGLDKLQKAKQQAEYDKNDNRQFTLNSLSVQTGLDSHTLCKIFNHNVRVDQKSLVQCFKVFNLVLEADDYESSSIPPSLINPGVHEQENSKEEPCVKCGLAPCVSVFYGRTVELATLHQWIQVDRCRLITVLGMGGIGKTSLVAKLIQQSATELEFEYIVWRSLRRAPTVEETLTEIIHVLSSQQDIDLPKSLNQLISRLILYLNQTRCLLVLDDIETILQAGERTGYYREEFGGYEELIRRVGESPHNSCLILTSRERPREMGLLEGKNYSIRSFLLKGLQPQDGLKILQAEGIDPTESEAQTLLDWYGGNPLEFKIAATTIHFLFLGDIDRFLARGTAAFGNIYDLLDQQFERLSDLEKTVLYWLAIHREPVFLPKLIDAIVPPVSSQKLLGTLENLGWRSVLEHTSTGFTLEIAMMEYVTDQFVEQIAGELRNGTLNLLNSHALFQATAKDDIREIQTRLILKSIADRITVNEAHWATLLQTCRSQPLLSSGYAAGNLLNLLCHHNQDLSCYDFSKLTIRQADLQRMNLQQVNFDQAHFIQSILPDPSP